MSGKRFISLEMNSQVPQKKYRGMERSRHAHPIWLPYQQAFSPADCCFLVPSSLPVIREHYFLWHSSTLPCTPYSIVKHPGSVSIITEGPSLCWRLPQDSDLAPHWMLLLFHSSSRNTTSTQPASRCRHPEALPLYSNSVFCCLTLWLSEYPLGMGVASRSAESHCPPSIPGYHHVLKT